MNTPSFADNIVSLKRLFEIYHKTRGSEKKGHPFVFHHIDIMIFFVIMTLRRIHRFKAMHRWLKYHPEIVKILQWEKIPHRTTLSRRYKAIYPVVQDFIRFLGKWAEDLGEPFGLTELFEDKSLFKAHGPVWHREWQKRGEIPGRLRNLDKDASWSYSGHHGWVYGYGLHLTVAESGFPINVAVETASVSESEVIDRKAGFIKETEPASVTGDNSYCNLSRIRSWAESGIALITPGKKLGNKKPEPAGYKQFVKEPENQHLPRLRKTAAEPAFDLIGKVPGLENSQKQIPVSGIDNVRTFLTLGTLIVRFAMIINSVWGLPIREISHITAIFT